MAVGVPGTMKVVSKAFAGGAGRATSPGGAGAPGAPASEGSVADAQPARLPAAAMTNRRRPRWCIPTIAPIRTGRALNERLLTPKVSRRQVSRQLGRCAHQLLPNARTNRWLARCHKAMSLGKHPSLRGCGLAERARANEGYRWHASAPGTPRPQSTRVDRWRDQPIIIPVR